MSFCVRIGSVLTEPPPAVPMRASCVEGQMIRAVNEVVLRVEDTTETSNSSEVNGVHEFRHVFHSDPRPRMLAEAKTSSVSSVECQERKLCEDTHDAIWEEAVSPSFGLGCALVKDPRGTHLSMERMDLAVPSFRRVIEARHRSLDFDIQMSELKLMKLQDRSCKPLSDLVLERDFSLRPRSAGAVMLSSQRPPAKLLSLSSRGTPKQGVVRSSLQRDAPACARNEQRASPSLQGEAGSCLDISKTEITKQQEPGRQSVSDRKAADEANLETLVRKSNCEDEASNEPFPKSTDLPKNFASDKLRKAKTKSRLVEPSISFRADKIATVPESTSNCSVARAEKENGEDPFEGVDVLGGDKFRQGNCSSLTLTQWAAFFIIIAGLACSLTVASLENHQVWGLELWKWFLLVLVVFCGRLVSGWLIRVMVILFEKNFLLRKKVLYFVYSLRKGVQNCLWLGLVFLAWKLIFEPRATRSAKNHKSLSLITKLLECFLIGAVIWLLKILLVKMLAASFHVSTFFDRIQETLFDQHVLEALSDPSRLNRGFESRNPGNRKNHPIRIQAVQDLNQQDVSAGHMKTLMSLVMHPGFSLLFPTLDEPVSLHDVKDEQRFEINSEMEAKAAAMRIFENVAQPDSSSIAEEDLLSFIDKEKVAKVLPCFEGADETGKITKKALKDWVVNVYKERKSLAHSLNDTKTAIDQLHNVASVLVSIIIVIIWLLVFGIASTHVLLFISSQLLLVGFMFSNTVKQVFEAIIFLFVMHPYDVGDRCVVDGIQMVVEEMNILSTVFLKGDNEKVYYPNAVLATKAISNLYRSPNMKDILDFSVHVSTSSDKIAALKDKITAYVERKSSHWHPTFSVSVKELEDLNRMRLSICMQHTINFQNMGDRTSRRSDLLLELKNFFQDLGIEYRLLPQSVQITQVSNVPPPQQQLIVPLF